MKTNLRLLTLAAAAPAKDLLKRKLALLMASHTVPASEPVPAIADQSSEAIEPPPAKRRRLSLGLKSSKRKG